MSIPGGYLAPADSLSGRVCGVSVSSMATSGAAALAQAGVRLESCHILVIAVRAFRNMVQDGTRGCDAYLFPLHRAGGEDQSSVYFRVFLCSTGPWPPQGLRRRLSGRPGGRVSHVDCGTALFFPTFYTEHSGQNLPSFRTGRPPANEHTQEMKCCPLLDHPSHLCGQEPIPDFLRPSESDRHQPSPHADQH